MLIPLLASEGSTGGGGTPVGIAPNAKGLATGNAYRRSPGAFTKARAIRSPISFTVGAVSTGSGTLTLTLQRTGSNISVPCGVILNISPGTADANDYATLSATTVTWASGETANKQVTLNIVDDNDTADQTFSVSLTPVLNAVAGTNAAIAVTILGKSTLALSAATYSVQAGNSLTVTVNRTGVLSLPCSVNLSTTNGTAVSGSDFTAPSPATLTWTAGESGSKTSAIATTNDGDSSDETFSLSLTSASGAVLGSPTAATVTITPGITYHPDTQDLIARLSADGLSRSTAELNLINTLITGLVTDGLWANVVDFSSHQVTGANALAIAQHKIKYYTGVPKVTFFDATNASFSRATGFTTIGGAGGGHFKTGVPQNLGVAGTSASRNRSMAIWPTANATANFAAWLSAGNGGTPWTARVGDPAASVLSHEFNSGSSSATGQTYTNKLLTFTIEAGGTTRIYNGATAVGTSPAASAIAPGTAPFGGHGYFNTAGDLVGTPYALSTLLYVFLNTGVTSTQQGNLQSRLNTFVTGMAAL